MKHWNQFDVVGFRKAGAAIHLLATFIVLLIIFLVIPAWGVPVAIVLALCYSPLRLFIWQADGTLGGYHGWGNALRYMGVLVVAAGLPPAINRASAIFSLGFMWGAFSWMSQENLSSVVAAVTLFLSLMWLSQTYGGRITIRAGLALAAGFCAFWLPVLSYYASKGAAAEFVRCYLLVPRAVVQGFSNTWWSSGTDDMQYAAFLLTTPFVIVLGLCTVVRFAPFELRSPLNDRQVRFLSFLSALAACYGASLFRSDSSHLVNTMIALPFVLTLAVVDLPEWLAQRQWARWGARAAIGAAAVCLYPIGPYFLHPVETLLRPPLQRFEPVAPLTANADARWPIQRATPALSDEPEVFARGWPMRELLEELSGVREIIGSRRTYIEGYPRAFQGLIYFLLNATPAPFLLDKMMMEINTPLREEAMAYYAAHVRETQCLISPNRKAPEVRLFLQAYPDARVHERMIGSRDYRVYCALQTPALPDKRRTDGKVPDRSDQAAGQRRGPPSEAPLAE
jgi:hypothetical protein